MMNNKKILAVLGVALLLAIGAMPASALAGGNLYMIDSPGIEGVASSLYHVTLSGSDANLVKLTDLVKGNVLMDRAVSLASNYMNILYFFDNYKPNTVSGTPLGTDLAGFYLIQPGMIQGFQNIVRTNGTPIPNISGAATDPFGSQGNTYVHSADTDSLYTVNFASGQAKLVGKVKSTLLAANTAVNLDGADIAFDLTNGNLYLWTNLARGAGAPKGLYKLTLPGTTPNDVLADYIGRPATGFQKITGLVIDENGTMYASKIAAGTVPSRIVTIDKTTGSFGTQYDMKLNGVPFVHLWGDLTISAFAP